MGKVQFLFFPLHNHNIILLNSPSILSHTHPFTLLFTHSLAQVTKYLTMQARVSSPQALQYFFVTVLHWIFPPAHCVYTVNYPAHFYCSLSLFSFCNGTYAIGQHDGAVVSTPTSQQEGPGLEFLPMFVWGSLSGPPGFLPQSKNTYVKLSGDSKLPVDVNMNMNAVYLYVWLCDRLAMWSGCTRGVPSCPAHPSHPQQDKQSS